jgi:(1->4)-alpha-D-glucan 1-alpha-D-glucosylmutase
VRRATYRVQLRSEYSFDHAAATIPYLDGLGISDLYCSPILQAADGSTHGYDVVDHSRLSADLGGEAAFGRMAGQLDQAGMGLTIDIVPNHMAIDGQANRWWWDVLENGPSSPYASYFDIDWPGDSGRHEQTVLVPVLGDRYGKVVESGEVRLSRHGGHFVLNYFDHEMPVSPRTLDNILDRAGRTAGSDALISLAGDFGGLPHASMTDPNTVAVRHEQKERLRERLAALLETEPGLGTAVDAEVAAVNADPEEVDRLLCRQNYRLAYWRTAREELDYRRFFNIETLVGLRVEDDQVFADTHEMVGRLVREGRVSGLRVDHVDGLRDPDGYLQRLRRLAGDAYIVVEKILDGDERLPGEWPVEGTTGYDFVTQVANVMVDRSGEDALTACYSRLTGEPAVYSEVVRAAKLQVMTEELAPEVDRLTRLLHGICDGHRRQRDRTRSEVHEALRATLAAFPVYRTYVQPDRPLRPADGEAVAAAVQGARSITPEADGDLLEFIGELLLMKWPGGAETRFAQIFPQLSAPVMAKGAEDTAFYRYNRLVSLNEVGGDPGTFGRPLADFHAAGRRAAADHPEAMLTLATHDTKRSPDVRARISLLSEIPDHWEEAVTRWMGLTDHHASADHPDYNARYLLFQTLVGAWPIPTDRLCAYMDKAAKEAKVHTSWADANPDYDYGLHKFIEATVGDAGFVAELETFLTVHRLVEWGRATSLAQTTLLLTYPGVPDIYQGTETWDNSLVDPDNRRPVDYGRLAADLAASSNSGPDHLAGGPPDDRAKTWLTARLLGHRRRRPDLYRGGYEPLPTDGSRAEHLIGYSRDRLVVLVGRHLRRLDGDWGDTTVELPDGSWRPVVGQGGDRNGGTHRVADLLGAGPVAVLEN